VIGILVSQSCFTNCAAFVPTISKILDGYLADRKHVVRGYATLENASKALKRHLGDLESGHLIKQRVRFYRRRRVIEGYEVGPVGAKRKKPVRMAPSSASW
jgi:hypothetical protein